MRGEASPDDLGSGGYPEIGTGASGRRARVAHAQRRSGPPLRRGGRATRSQLGRSGRSGSAVRPERARRRPVRVPLARLPPPVPRPDADRAARGRHRQPLPAQAARHRHPADPADPVQRGRGPASGGEGHRGRFRPAEDGGHHGQGAAGWPAVGAPRRATGSRRHRRGRCGRYRARGRAAAEGGHAGGRRVRADRGEPARRQGNRARGGRRHAAGRPDRHGLHEHQRHPRHRRVRHHRDRDGHRGRPHLRAAGRCQARRSGSATGSVTCASAACIRCLSATGADR